MSPERKKEFTTVSGIPLKKVYTPADINDLQPNKDIGLPGEPPYVRGIYPNMYRERLWRIFQLSGSGTTEETRDRVKMLVEAGERGITFEQDRMVCYSMLDVDDPDVVYRKEDVGLYGAPVMCLKDLEILLEGIPIEKLFVRWGMYPMQISFEQACYFVIAEKRGLKLSDLAGQSHGGMFAGYIGTPIYKQIPPRAGNRFVCDGIEFCIQHKMDKWVPSTSAGHNARANGINAYQELAMVVAQQMMRMDELIKRGTVDPEDVASRLAAVNFSVHDDFFEDMCKIRAARRLWYRIFKEKYHIQNPRGLCLRVQGLTCSQTFTYQQPLNNIARNTLRATAAALAGVQALGTASYDEAISVPSRAAAINSIRTQQIVQHESGICDVVDPLGGSYYVEWLTNELDRRASEYLEEIEKRGGFISIIENGWAHAEAAKGAQEWERKVNNGEWTWVGVNAFQAQEDMLQVNPHPPTKGVWEQAMARLEKLRRERDSARVKDVMAELREVALSDKNILPTMMKAVQADITVGEVGNLWRDIFGIWKAPLPL
ncbi:MAG: methylmalonyl-CoA mutase family protein [Chloroflexota bacterium]